MFTQPMQNKTDDATLEALRAIIRANGNIMPKEITNKFGKRVHTTGIRDCKQRGYCKEEEHDSC